MCTVFFSSELNYIEIRTGDIINSHLTARTTENIVFYYRPKFDPFGHVGHLLLVKTALYGLKILCVRFHSRLSDSLTALGFVPSMGGFDIWVCDEGGYYSYVAWYCDDLIVIHKYPDHLFDSVRVKGFTVKYTSAPKYFLGVNL